MSLVRYKFYTIFSFEEFYRNILLEKKSFVCNLAWICRERWIIYLNRICLFDIELLN